MLLQQFERQHAKFVALDSNASIACIFSESQEQSSRSRSWSRLLGSSTSMASSGTDDRMCRKDHRLAIFIGRRG